MKLLIFNTLLFFTLSSTVFAARPNWVHPENWVQITGNLGFVIESKPRETEKIEVTTEMIVDGDKTPVKAKGIITEYDHRPVTGYFLMYVNKDWRRVNVDSQAVFSYVHE